MEISNIYRKKIEDINNGLWTVNSHEFYVEIEINNKAEENNNQIYYRLFHQNELAAIQTQIIISDLINTEDENDPYKIFDDHFQKMKKYLKVVEFLSLQGITKFESIKRKDFNSFEVVFNKNFIYFQNPYLEEEEEEEYLPFEIYQNPPKTKFLTGNIQHSTIRIIGEIIQENEDVFLKLVPYIRCILGHDLSRDLFYDQFNLFMKKQSYDVLFDPFKLGSKFYQHFSNPNILSSIVESFQNYDQKIIDDISKLKDKINFDFTGKLIKCFDKNNLLFLKTLRSSHCYHCIRSITRIITNFHPKSLFYLNENTLIFCHNDKNFVERITKLKKAYFKDSKCNDSRLTYFIIHPEILNEEYHTCLVEFLNLRMNSLLDKNFPKVFIISSLDYRIFCYEHLQKFNDIEIKIPKEVIEYLYELSHPDYPNDYCYQLYYSEKAGSGKTYQIIQDFNEKKNCIPSQNHVLKSLFVDISMKKIPKLEYVKNNETKKYEYVHLDLSPELFDNNYQFFDNLWTFTVLHHQINSDGKNSETPPNIFFEVPTLSKKQFPDGGFINKYDFPIYCNYYHKISATKVTGDEETPAQIQIPENVKKFCDIVFKDEIKYTSELLKTIFKMFYPNNMFNESCFVPRILEEINDFMNYFCKNLSLVDEISKIIFLLLLRTNFHVWNMENIFTDKSQPKSFIIMSNENLFSNELDPNKWVLLCFSSIEEKNTKWNTEFLKDDIKYLGEIDESNLFECQLFKPLLNNPNINIFTNQSIYSNYENDQSYFFIIIKAFFYHNVDKENLYRKITDGVILYNFKNNDTFENDKNVLPYILDGQRLYEQNKEYTRIHKWTKVFYSLQSILVDYKDEEPINLVHKLTNDEKISETIKQISNITLTMTIVKRFVIMILRIILKQPLIFEGFTGVGKTLCVTLLKKMIEITKRNKDFDWAYHQIDCNDDLQLNELLNIQKNELMKNQNPSLNHIFFFDNLNTSPVSNYVINEMNNYYLKKKYLLMFEASKGYFLNSSIVFIAAINPYIKVDQFSRNLSRVGIRQVIPNRISKLNLCSITPKDNKNLYEVTDLNKLAYNVRELSDSNKMIVLKFDPEPFFFNKDDQNIESSIYLPPDEIKTIGHIIDYYLKILIRQTDPDLTVNLLKNDKKTEIEDDKKRQSNLETIHCILTKYKSHIHNIFLSLLCKSFLEIRELMRLKSILSFYDVKRTMQFFILFFTKLIKVYLRKDGSPDITISVLNNHIIPQSIVLSIMISIVFRFSNETRIETADRNISNSNEEEEKILARCAKFGLKPTFSEDRSYFKVDIRSVLLKKLVEINVWPRCFAKPKTPEDWNQIVISYSWLKCSKYIYAGKNNITNSCLFKFNSLMINLFSISSCYSASKNNKNCVIPCIIIGIPGTSKTLAIQLFTDYKQTYGKSKDKFFNTTYPSTRFSESEGLNASYKDCAMFMMAKNDYFAVCVIDQLNEMHPLKSFHYYFDKGIRMETKDGNLINAPVMTIAASNYALDYASMNRVVLICTELPTDKAIAEAFYFSQLEENRTKFNEEIIKKYKNEFFDPENDFFDWKKDPENKIATYKYFLEILWSLTYKKERPDMLILRPLYLLINSIFNNGQQEYDDELVNNLCLYLISAINCKPSDSFTKVNALITKLYEDEFIKETLSEAKIKSLKQIIDEQKENSFIAFKEIFNGPKNNTHYQEFCRIVQNQVKKEDHLESYDKIESIIDKEENPFDFFRDVIEQEDEENEYYKALKTISNPGIPFKKLTESINSPEYDNYKILRQSIRSPGYKRAFCFRSKNYECLDFVEELLGTMTMHYLEKKLSNIEFVHIYPNDFKRSKQISADSVIEKLINIIKENNTKKMYYFLIVGNVSLTDAILDLLNSPSDGKCSIKIKNPLININGFSVELDKFPKNVTFCFVINEKDFQNRDSIDSFPILLLERLNQITLDYDQRDEFGIIEKYKKYHDDNIDYSTPYSTIIHEYFSQFVDNLKDIPISSYEKENSHAIVYATTNIHKSFYEKAEKEGILCKFDLHDDFDSIDWNKKIILLLFNRIVDNIEKCRENIDKFEQINKEGEKSLTFFWSKEFTKLLNKKFTGFEFLLPKSDYYDLYLENDGSINNLIGKITSDNNKQMTNKAIIVTTSPLMENIILDKVPNGITHKNTEFLFDQYILSVEDFYERIDKENKENIVIQLDHFQIEHDRYLRYLLESFCDKKYTIIIYHIKNRNIPEGLYTSLNWPVYWIESITDSPLSKLKTTEIVDCISLNVLYKERMTDLYHKIFRQVYNDIDSHFEDHIDDNNVNEILDFIYIGLKEKLALNSVDFTGLIDKFEGKTIKNSYKNLDFKEEFRNIIINQIPFLEHLIQVIILNRGSIIMNSISDTKTFLSKLFKEDIEELFKIADLDNRNYIQLHGDGLYFPELIFPQVLSIYEVYSRKGTNYPKIDINIFKKFNNLQIDPRNDYLENYCYCYFMSYLNEMDIYKEPVFQGFYEKLKEIIHNTENEEINKNDQKKNEECEINKNKNSKIKQENDIIMKENIILTKKIEDLNLQLANKTKEFNSNLETQVKEINNLKKQLDEMQKKNEEYEIIKNQNSKIKQENAKYKNEITILTKKAEELNLQLVNKTREFNLNLETKTEENKNLKKQLDEFLKKSNNEKIKLLDSTEINNLEVIEEIGSGGGGRVLKVAMKEMYALKIMKVDKDSDINIISLKNLMNEYEIMNMLNHPNILKTYGIFLSDDKNPPSILLEFCPMNLNEALKKKALTKVQIVCSIYQIIEGMKYVHFKKIIHRDLKPSNILISNDGKIKIGDFGIAKLMSLDQQLTTGGIGTQKFMAPEIINEEDYNEKADVYSFGVLVYTILNNGQLPVIKIRDICIGKKAEIPSNFTEFSKNLINACWNFEPENRPSFEMILNDLDRNKFNLIELTKSELTEIEEFVQNHKSVIPHYSNK